MNRSPFGAGSLIGIIVGVFLGMAYLRAKVAWSAFRTVKAAVPIARRTAWSLTGALIKMAAITAFVVLIAMAISTNDRKGAHHGTPTSTNSAAPTAS